MGPVAAMDESSAGEAIVSKARAWIGTPYQHQASCRGAGTDCLGLLRGVWREIVGDEPESVPAYTPDWSEPNRSEELLMAARRNLISIDMHARRPGDVALMRMRPGSVAKHVGFLGQAPLGHETLIHAYCGYGVVESSLDQSWRSKIVAVFRFPIRRP